MNWIKSRLNFVDLTVLGMIFSAIMLAINAESVRSDIPDWTIRMSIGYMIVGGVWVIMSSMTPTWQRVLAWSLVAAAAFTTVVQIVHLWPFSVLIMLGAISQVWRASRNRETYRDL